MQEIEAPLAQAKRCLDQWLREEGRTLPPRLRNRAAALMARYFLNEAQMNDALMLSFLRHYSGFGEVDFDDPGAIRRALAAVLDKTAHAGAGGASIPPHRAMQITAIAACLTSIIWLGWNAWHMTITPAQQALLRMAVDRRAASEHLPHATVWADLKRDYNVRRYQEIRRYDYNAALKKLQMGE